MKGEGEQQGKNDFHFIIVKDKTTSPVKKNIDTHQGQGNRKR